MRRGNLEAVRVDFDPEVRAWYLTLSDAPVSKTVHISDEVAVDVDGQDDPIGVEFLLAPAELSSEVRKTLFERFPAVRSALSDLQALAVV
jgi:uncharacterized protein YuzE